MSSANQCARPTAGLPPPSRVLSEAWPIISDPFFDNGGTDKGLFWHILASLQRVALGFLLAVVAGVMLGTLPAMSTLIAAVVLRERQTLRDWGAAALATAGVLFVTFAPGQAMPSLQTLAGDALVLAAVACEAVFILLNRRLSAPLPPLALSTAMSGLGFVLALVPAAFEWHAAAAGWTIGAVSAIAYYALVPTVLGYVCWYAGSARTSGTEAALFTAVAPVSAVLFAVALFGETLGGTRLLGIALVVAGMLAGATRRREPPARDTTAPSALPARPAASSPTAD